MGVARSLGMAATDARVDSEVVWVRITGSG
jgi:hypothetical protein